MPPTEVTVHVNRGNTDTLETATGTLEANESFALVLRGHEAPAHVHCRLDGDLAHAASIEGSNYYVEPGDVTAVPVDIAAALDEPVEGRLEVLAGYGSESVSIPVTVAPGPSVDVDESLADPDPERSAPDPTPVERLLAGVSGTVGAEPATLAVLALGLIAVGIGVLTAATIGGPVTLFGVGIVVVGFVVALGLLLQ